MNIKHVILFISVSCAQVIYANTAPGIITLTCPSVTAIDINKIKEPSWASYTYKAFTFIQLPELENKLELTGKGIASHVSTFQAATWTDRVFLCNYNSQLNAVVLFETQLNQYVKRCYFKTAGISECLSTDPSQCVLRCELGQIDS